jgi:hypothetical protein
MICHFSHADAIELPVPAQVSLGLSAGEAALAGGQLRLGPLSGAVLR